MSEEKKYNVKAKARRSINDPLYGVYRCFSKNEAGEDEGYWKVSVHKITDVLDGEYTDGTKKQVLAFPVGTFWDKDFPKTGRDGVDHALDAAKAYRDEHLKMHNLAEVKKVNVSIRRGRVDSPFVREHKRRTHEMFGITRDDRTMKDGRIGGGWKVRIQEFREFFVDSNYGGREGCLAAAKKRRDEIMETKNVKAVTERQGFILQSPLRAMREKLDINIATAAIWMGMSLKAFQKMEKEEGKASEAFIELFRRFAYGIIDPSEYVPEPAPKEIREKLCRSQGEMSKLITGKEGQSPWCNWETGRNRMPLWAWKYVWLIATKEFAKKSN